MSIRYNHAVATRGSTWQAKPPDRRSLRTRLLRYVAVIGAIAVLVAFFRRVPLNPTTVALTFLLLVLVVASRWGLTLATTAAIISTLAFNYFFLPPLGTFVISDPQNWVALLAFLITSSVASP